MLAIWRTTNLAWTWYVLVGTAVCFAVGYTASVLLPEKGTVRTAAS
jgi:hypothetical protein